MVTLFLLMMLADGGKPGPFVSQEAAFSVRFPATPMQDAMTVPTLVGPQLRHVFRHSDDEVVYFVVHACTPPPTLPADPQKALDLGRDGGLEMSGATLVSESRVLVEGHLGRRVVATLPGGEESYSLAVLGDNGAFYSVVAGPRSKAATRKALAFLDSFKILPTTARALCRPE